MHRYPVPGKGDMEDRRGVPSLAPFGPAGQMADLAQWILFQMKSDPKMVAQYFNPHSELGKLQEAFGVQAPWVSQYFPSRLQ
jgi:hypothetical protein